LKDVQLESEQKDLLHHGYNFQVEWARLISGCE